MKYRYFFLSAIILFEILLGSVSQALAASIGDLSTTTTGDQTGGFVITINGVKWLVSNYRTGGTSGALTTGTDWTMVMALDNFGNTVYNSANKNNTMGSTMTDKLTAIYNSLPATIGGVAKANAIRSTAWDMDSFSGDMPSSRLTSTSDGAVSPNPMTSYLNLASFYDWQRGQDTGANTPSTSYTTEPATNSLGDLWCRARFGTIGTNNNCIGMVCQSNVADGADYCPWLRSPVAGQSSYVWYVTGAADASLLAYNASEAYGVVPVMYLASNSICTDTGSGTYASPYTLKACNVVPTVTTAAAQTANNGATSTVLSNSYVKNGNKLYISGTIIDPDAQNFTVSYSLSASTTPGSWTVCRSASSTSTYSSFTKKLSSDDLVVV